MVTGKGCSVNLFFRGKLSELERLLKTVFCNDWASFAKILYDRGGKDVLNMLLVGNKEYETMAVQYRGLLEEAGETPFLNPFIGSLVTAYARRALNQELIQLGRRVIYW